MYRFNQAWMLDSTNSDVYSGFGGVYMILGDFKRAREQYDQGLAADPKIPHLLTDYGTYFMSQYYILAGMGDNINAGPNLDSAITYLQRSYKQDKKDQNSTFKLSAC